MDLMIIPSLSIYITVESFTGSHFHKMGTRRQEIVIYYSYFKQDHQFLKLYRKRHVLQQEVRTGTVALYLVPPAILSPVLSTCYYNHFIPILGVGKTGAY